MNKSFSRQEKDTYIHIKYIWKNTYIHITQALIQRYVSSCAQWHIGLFNKIQIDDTNRSFKEWTVLSCSPCLKVLNPCVSTVHNPQCSLNLNLDFIWFNISWVSFHNHGQYAINVVLSSPICINLFSIQSLKHSDFKTLDFSNKGVTIYFKGALVIV